MCGILCACFQQKIVCQLSIRIVLSFTVPLQYLISSFVRPLCVCACVRVCVCVCFKLSMFGPYHRVQGMVRSKEFFAKPTMAQEPLLMHVRV